MDNEDTSIEPISSNEEGATYPTPPPQGAWGKRSRKEISLLVCAAILLVSGLVTTLLLVPSDECTSDSVDEPSKGSSLPVVVEPVIRVDSPQDKLDIIRESFLDFDVTSKYLQSIPQDASSLRDKDLDKSAPPEVRAAAWLVHKDTHNERHQLIRRFALSTIYHASGGDSWKDSTNWLSEKSHCEWKGIGCCSTMLVGLACHRKPLQAVSEIDLFRNNLIGELNDALVLLRELQVLYLAGNALTGEINAAALSQLPSLTKLYLQENKLSGTVPTMLEMNEKLDTLYVQDNDLTGLWPAELCPSCRKCTDKVKFFAMDCDEVKCMAQCCDPWDNCFYRNSQAEAA